MIREDLLYYIWEKRLMQEPLTLVKGETLEILHPGYRNYESGPDFFNARLRINGLVWAGNVEIHVKSSDWLRHGHTGDTTYEQVILHAVFRNDVAITRSDGLLLPTLEMENRFPSHYLQHYLQLTETPSDFVPCGKQVQQIPPIQLTAWLQRMFIERLEQRYHELQALHDQCKGSWPETWYRWFGKAFGFRVNALPFELLCASTPFALVQKHRHDREQLEALFIGQAGLLPPHSTHAYPQRLLRQYRFFRKKYNLGGIGGYTWKTGGIRPGNQPLLRLSQFAAAWHQHPAMADALIAGQELKDVLPLFELQASDYFAHHLAFGEDHTPATRQTGSEAIYLLLINAVLPYLFFVGRKQHKPALVDKVLSWSEQCRPENNRVQRGWQQCGIKAGDAGMTQALYHLKKNYCDHKKCVTCGIGQHLLGKHELIS